MFNSKNRQRKCNLGLHEYKKVKQRFGNLFTTKLKCVHCDYELFNKTLKNEN